MPCELFGTAANSWPLSEIWKCTLVGHLLRSSGHFQIKHPDMEEYPSYILHTMKMGLLVGIDTSIYLKSATSTSEYKR